MDLKKTVVTPNPGQRMLENWSSHTLLVGMEASTATLKNNLAAPLETKVDFPYNLAITLLGIYPSESKTDFHTAHKCSQLPYL